MVKLLKDKIGDSEAYLLPSATFDLENVCYIDTNEKFTDLVAKKHSVMWVLTYTLDVIPSENYPGLTKAQLEKIRAEQKSNYETIEMVYVHPYRSSLMDIRAIIPAIYQNFIMDETWCEFTNSICTMQPLTPMEFVKRYGLTAMKVGKMNTHTFNVDYIHHDDPEDWVQYNQSTNLEK